MDNQGEAYLWNAYDGQDYWIVKTPNEPDCRVELTVGNRESVSTWTLYDKETMTVINMLSTVGGYTTNWTNIVWPAEPDRYYLIGVKTVSA